MAINQPPINDDLIKGSWELQVTNDVNLTEQRVVQLESLIASLQPTRVSSLLQLPRNPVFGAEMFVTTDIGSPVRFARGWYKHNGESGDSAWVSIG